MAEVTDSVALLSLEEDLTCSICLCPFENPVSLNCGHSFCLHCLEGTWRDATSYFCPHCRAHYLTKPILKKNTVLSAVVETFKTKAGAGGSTESETREPRARPVPKPKPILCDTCMEVKAVKTCLTCMASYCAEHVRPHQENPVFRAHELCEPLSDLKERLCPEHAKLMEFYCARHERSICSSCLQLSHKDCGFSALGEQRGKKESELRHNLNTLEGKIEKNQLVISQMKEQQTKLKEMAAVRKRALEMEYQQIRDMLQRDEREAMDALEKELESGHNKLNTLMKKFNQNVEKMSLTRAEINNLLASSQSVEFLQASVEMPSVVTFDPYSPRINLDSKRIIAYHSCIVTLKEYMSKVLREPVDTRISVLKPELGNPVGQISLFNSERPRIEPVHESNIHGQPPRPWKGEKRDNRDQRERKAENAFTPFLRESAEAYTGFGPAIGEDMRPLSPGSQNKGPPGGARKKQQQPRDRKENREHKGERGKKPPNKPLNAAISRSMDNLSDLATQNRVSVPIDLSITPGTAAKRSDLLQYGVMLTFDARTAHKRVALSENNHRASVSDEPSAYPDGPARFTVCSQVLCTQRFSQGRHYWEVKLSSNNFCGLGLAYGSIDRKGPSSRLGRNAQSWCIEWFNVKLSAWHNSNETVLINPNPSRIGVLLDCDNSTATFYSVSDRAYPLHTFVFPFIEPVFPAFWMFSSGSAITLCSPSN